MNGNGRLNKREFQKLLASFNIKLNNTDLDLLVDRFDVDGDGELDLNEFVDFIKKDINVHSDIKISTPFGTAASATNSSGLSISKTVQYNDIPGNNSAGDDEVTGKIISIESLFQKQKQIEDKLGKQYFSK